MRHKLKLSTGPFNIIKAGEKVIESRLYDAKRQRISIGDEIEFSENDKPENKVLTEVTGLLRYQSFKELFANHHPSLFGEESREILMLQIRQFYSEEEENKYGIVGIRIQLID